MDIFLQLFVGDAHADYCMDRDQLNSPFYVWVLTSFNNFFLVFNSSINFVVYCFVGKRFRNTLISFFRKPSTNVKTITQLPSTQEGTAPQTRLHSLRATSLDQCPPSSRKHSFVTSGLSLPQINEGTVTSDSKSTQKSAHGNFLLINNKEMVLFASSDNTR